MEKIHHKNTNQRKLHGRVLIPDFKEKKIIRYTGTHYIIRVPITKNHNFNVSSNTASITR